MGGRIRGFDWAGTGLGDIARWPESLKAGVETMLAAGLPTALAWGSGLTVLFNDAWRRQIGGADALGRAASDEDGPPWSGLARPLSEALERGEARTVAGADGLPPFRILPVFGETGGPAGLSIRAEGRQADGADSAEDRQRMLQSEFQHRLRNLLAIIRSITRRTAESAETVEDFASHLEGRIDAVARVQTPISRFSESCVDFETILREEMRAAVASAERTTIHGPEVALQPRAAQTLSLALHELTTNAVKFGALSEPDGTLEVGWAVDGSDLSISWEERGVRIPTPPTRRGFGTEMLERTLPYELKARVSYRYGANGFSCRISLALPESRGGR